MKMKNNCLKDESRIYSVSFAKKKIISHDITLSSFLSFLIFFFGCNMNYYFLTFTVFSRFLSFRFYLCHCFFFSSCSSLFVQYFFLCHVFADSAMQIEKSVRCILLRTLGVDEHEFPLVFMITYQIKIIVQRHKIEKFSFILFLFNFPYFWNFRSNINLNIVGNFLLCLS